MRSGSASPASCQQGCSGPRGASRAQRAEHQAESARMQVETTPRMGRARRAPRLPAITSRHLGQTRLLGMPLVAPRRTAAADRSRRVCLMASSFERNEVGPRRDRGARGAGGSHAQREKGHGQRRLPALVGLQRDAPPNVAANAVGSSRGARTRCTAAEFGARPCAPTTSKHAVTAGLERTRARRRAARRRH